MGNKDKGGRETRKPKKDKKAKPAAGAPSPIIPPSTHSQDHPQAGSH
jgi:hypothetical protein